MNYCKARSLSDFFQKTSEAEGLTRPLAGGTDIMYRLKKRFLLSDRLTLIDINGLDELKKIDERDDELEIGSATTLSSLEEFLKDMDGFSLLYTALRETACPQIRNQGTLGGHLAGCLPNSHLFPVLMLYGAGANIVESEGKKRIPVEELFRGPYHNRLKSGELVMSLTIPRKDFRWESYWGEGSRKQFSLASFVLALAVDSDGNRCIAGGAPNFLPTHFRVLESAPPCFHGDRTTLLNLVKEEVRAQERRKNRLSDYQKTLLFRLIGDMAEMEARL